MRPFAYERADDAGRASELTADGGGAHLLLAGGTTVLDLMKLDVLTPDTLVDINGLAAEHGAISADADGLRLGALARMADAAEHPVISTEYPVIAQSLKLAASEQLRHMASLGGNVLQRTRCAYFRDTRWTACNKRAPGSGCAALEGNTRQHAVLGVGEGCIATYAGDFAQALVALDASVDTAREGEARTFPFAELHTGPEQPHRETTLAPGEVITGFTVPAGPWTRRSTYLKIRDRQSYEFALASAAVALDLDDDARVRTARVALGGLAYRPWRAREAEAQLEGAVLDEASAARAADAAFAGARARPGNAYKISLGRATLIRALLETTSMAIA
jgi:xanthine dehydrogenase YagS FAD-binding subunit